MRIPAAVLALVVGAGIMGAGLMPALAQNSSGSTDLGRQFFELLTRRSSERAAALCTDRAEEEGYNVRSVVRTRSTNSGFVVVLRVRENGDGRNLNCNYDVDRDRATLQRSNNDYADDDDDRAISGSDYMGMPIVRAIAACVDAAGEEGIGREGVMSAEFDGRKSSVTFAEERGGRRHLCVHDHRRRSNSLFVQDGQRWVSLDRRQQSDAVQQRAEQACEDALRKNGASLRQVESARREGKRLILQLRARRNGNSFDTTCRFNVRTGFASIVR